MSEKIWYIIAVQISHDKCYLQVYATNYLS